MLPVVSNNFLPDARLSYNSFSLVLVVLPITSVQVFWALEVILYMANIVQYPGISIDFS